MKKHFSLKKRGMLYLTYLLIFVFIFVLNCLTPLSADDFSYSFSFADNSRIQSIAQIIESMVAHREVMNGRVFVHAFVSFFLMLPKPVFNVINALNFIFLLHLINSMCGARALSHRLVLSICGFFLLWNYVPKFSQIFLWLDGSVNYSWVLSVLLLFLLPYIRYYTEAKRMAGWVWPLFFILSFVGGTCGESYSMTALIMAVALVIVSRMKGDKICPELVLGVVAALLGFMFLLFAPASSSRIGALDVSSLIENVLHIGTLVKEELMLLYMVYAGLLAVALLKKFDSKYITLSVLLVFGGFVSLAGYSIAIGFTYRYLFFATVTVIAAILMIMAEFLEKNLITLPVVCLAVLAVLFVFNTFFGVIDIAAGYLNAAEREQVIVQAQEQQQSTITLTPHIPSTDYCVDFDLSPDKTEWPNISVASFYGFEYVIRAD